MDTQTSPGRRCLCRKAERENGQDRVGGDRMSPDYQDDLTLDALRDELSEEQPKNPYIWRQRP